jgi:hypothetical protein
VASAASFWAYPLAGLSAADRLAAGRGDAAEIHQLTGLNAAHPLQVSSAARATGAIAQTLTTAGDTTTVERDP